MAEAAAGVGAEMAEAAAGVAAEMVEAAVGVVAEMAEALLLVVQMQVVALEVVAALHAPIYMQMMLPREFGPYSTTVLLLLLVKPTMTTTLGSFCGCMTTGITTSYLRGYLTPYTRHTFKTLNTQLQGVRQVN